MRKSEHQPHARMLAAGNLSVHQILALKQIQAILATMDEDSLYLVRSLTRQEYRKAQRDLAFEHFIRARAGTDFYTWFEALRDDGPLVVDFVLAHEALTDIAKRHSIHYRTARRRFCSALNAWKID